MKVVDKRTQLMKRRVGSGVTIVSPGGMTGVQDFPICSLQRTTGCVTIALKYYNTILNTHNLEYTCI